MNTLFHYCSPTSFAAMVSQRSVWLSSLTLSNDYMEGKLLASTFESIFRRESLEEEVVSPLRSALARLTELFDGLGFCLSEQGDLLSQWRGYAADGQGFSIGFSGNYLQQLADIREEDRPGFTLNRVIYAPSEQERALLPTYEELKLEIDAGKLKTPRPPGLLWHGDPAAERRYEEEKKAYEQAVRSVLTKIAGSIRNLYTLKNEAFSEEREWRLISFLTKNPYDHCLYRASTNRLIPYRVFELKQLDAPAITEVIIGPKNSTPEYVVEMMLEQNGFAGVKVRRSSATYR